MIHCPQQQKHQIWSLFFFVSLIIFFFVSFFFSNRHKIVHVVRHFFSKQKHFFLFFFSPLHKITQHTQIAESGKNTYEQHWDTFFFFKLSFFSFLSHLFVCVKHFKRKWLGFFFVKFLLDFFLLFEKNKETKGSSFFFVCFSCVRVVVDGQVR